MSVDYEEYKTLTSVELFYRMGLISHELLERSSILEEENAILREMVNNPSSFQWGKRYVVTEDIELCFHKEGEDPDWTDQDYLSVIPAGTVYECVRTSYPSPPVGLKRQGDYDYITKNAFYWDVLLEVLEEI